MVVNGTRILNESTVEEMHKIQPPGNKYSFYYGLAWLLLSRSIWIGLQYPLFFILHFPNVIYSGHGGDISYGLHTKMNMKISENTQIGLPLRNLIGLISAIVVGAWFAFGVIERLNNLETRNKLFEQDLLEASTQKPIDQEQFMLIEDLYKTVEKLQSTQEMNMTNKVNIEFHTKQIEKLLSDVEKLKDKQREFANGNNY